MYRLLVFLIAALGIAGNGLAQEETSDIQILLDADFTVFTDGSEASPVSLYNSTFNQKVSGFNYVSGVSAAGGKILIGPSGYIEAKQFESLPTTGGVTLRVTAEVKMLDSYGGCVQIKRGYSSDAVNVIVESDEWTTITTYASGYVGTSSSRMRISPFLSVNGFYIKSLKVEYSPDFIAAPEAYLPSDADGTSFTASCSRVSGAATYEADVFTLDSEGNPEYTRQNVELTALSVYSLPEAKITDLDSEKTYYYVARAVLANGKKSEDSYPVEVVKKIESIDSPEALAPTNVTESGFTANWNAVADAEFYILNTYVTETLGQESTVNIFEEDFSGVNIGTLSSVEFSGNLNSFTSVPGWETDLNKAFAAGYFVFSPYQGACQLITPAIDLSANDGAFTVKLNAATGAYGTFRSTANTLAVEIVEGDIDNATVIESAAAAICDKTDFSNFTFNFTKGSAATRLRITYTQVDGNTDKLFLDEIAVSQVMAAGSVITKQLSSENVDDTSLDVTLTPVAEKEYSYDVIAVGKTVTGSGASAQVSTIQSAVSNRVVVDFTSSGISEIATESALGAWKEARGMIGINGSDVRVVNLQGHTILQNKYPAGTHSIRVNASGMVIVIVDGKSYKVII